MTDSMAQADEGFVKPLEPAAWKTAASWIAACLLAALFLVSGLWKITDSQAAAIRMTQARVPAELGLAAALTVGILETVAGALLVAPRFRRWGALLAGALLIVFMIYVGAQYNALRGEDCSCFPWVKRMVGPAFFIGDLVMLGLACVAWLWSHPSESRRSAVLVVGAVAVFALVCYGANAVRSTGIRAPASITVDGKPLSLQQGKVFLFFFHPQCMHCFDAAKRMSEAKWAGARVVGVPVEHPAWGAQFMEDTGLRASISPDFDLLSRVFHYTTYPWGVVVENGREKAALTKFDAEEPLATLRKLGFIE